MSGLCPRGLALVLVVVLVNGGCAVYRPFAVLTTASNFPLILSPVVNETPVVQDADFNVYQDASVPTRYLVVPTAVQPIEAERGKLLAVALERYDGDHLILVADLGPRADLLAGARSKVAALGIKPTAIEFYPIDQITIRLLTDPRRVADLSFTAVPAPGLTISPFHVLFIVQIVSNDNIVAFKKLLNSNAGLLFEGTYVLRARSASGDITKPLTFKGVIGNTEITSLSN